MAFDQEQHFEAGSAGRSTAAFLPECQDNPGSVNLRIHAEDEKFLRELADAAGDKDLATWRYLRTGDSLARTVGRFIDWDFGAFSNLTSFLDFACGE